MCQGIVLALSFVNVLDTSFFMSLLKPDLSDFPCFLPPQKTHIFHLSLSEIWLTAMEKGI